MELRQTNKSYHTDHSIVYSCQYHVIFCPKYRRKVLTGAVAERMRDLVLAKRAEYGYAVMDMAVQPDHVYLLLDVDPRIGVVTVRCKSAIAYVLLEVKDEESSGISIGW